MRTMWSTNCAVITLFCLNLFPIIAIVQAALEADTGSADQDFDRSFFSAILAKLNGGRKVKISLETNRKLSYEQDRDASCPACSGRQPTDEASTVVYVARSTRSTQSTSSSTTALPSTVHVPSNPLSQLTLFAATGDTFDVGCGDVAVAWYLELLTPDGESLGLADDQTLLLGATNGLADVVSLFSIPDRRSLLIQYAGGYYSAVNYDTVATFEVSVTDSAGGQTNIIPLTAIIRSCSGTTTTMPAPDPFADIGTQSTVAIESTTTGTTIDVTQWPLFNYWDEFYLSPITGYTSGTSGVVPCNSPAFSGFASVYPTHKTTTPPTYDIQGATNLTTEVQSSSNNDYNRYIVADPNDPNGMSYTGTYPFATAAEDVIQTIKVQISDSTGLLHTDPIYLLVTFQACGGVTTTTAAGGATSTQNSIIPSFTSYILSTPTSSGMGINCVQGYTQNILALALTNNGAEVPLSNYQLNVTTIYNTFADDSVSLWPSNSSAVALDYNGMYPSYALSHPVSQQYFQTVKVQVTDPISGESTNAVYIQVSFFGCPV